mmetsp:Transcript_32787/g.39279  ORF Transcript_32787/g.39279 Transcript_32787/m.39279 type:complete len:138 (-) Transcript_32787:257-670(-)
MMEEISQMQQYYYYDSSDPTSTTTTITTPTSRQLVSWFSWSFNLTNLDFGNTTENIQDAAENLADNLQPASDVDIEGVHAAIYFNALVFVVLAILYECLRKFFPSVYASRQTRRRKQRSGDGDGGGGGSILLLLLLS